MPDHYEAPSLHVLGTERTFCCTGCQAVCTAIVGAGLEDYYQHRKRPAASPGRSSVPELLKQLELYDRPEIQRDFVRDSNGSCETSLILEDIRCPSCLWLNEKRLRRLSGVVEVAIDDARHRAWIRWDPAQIQLSAILKAISDIGYVAHPYDATRDRELLRARERRSAERLIFAGAAGMVIMNFSVATYLMGAPQADGQLPLWVVIGRWTSLAVALTILAYPGQDFFAGAWSDMRKRRLGMDIPIVLGLTAALLGSLYATVAVRGDVYFDSIAMFVFFLLLARRWEMQGRLRASDRLDRLARTTPRKARRLDDVGRWTEVAAIDLQPGEAIRVLPGEALAVDGVVVEGSSSFDESLVTGESAPVLHHPGDPVIAGSVNGEQPVTVRVTHGVRTSAVSEIQRLVELGVSRRPAYALMAERVARSFVAAVLIVAGATAAYWLQHDSAAWLGNTIAVLIVTCPCALALATPVALAVAAQRFLELGVMPLRMQALDSLALGDLAAFDKTGTLTTGQPALMAVTSTGRLESDEILDYAAALAAASEHPIARALRQTEPRAGLAIEGATNVAGEGIRAMIAGREWHLGKPGTAACGSPMSPSVRSCVEQERARGRTVSLLTGPDGVEAILAFADPLREGAASMLEGLQKLGVKAFAILSGDAQASVEQIRKQLAIGTAKSGMTPADKLAWIRTRQQQGHRVIMFGDGINDAPVLAAADASVSFSDGTDLANASSDFLLLGKDPGALADARALARRTRSNILQNLAWAAAYNIVAVPAAAAGLIPPWGAAIGMSVSSLIVVLNALRLQK